jgi:para-nitrobenzyl esterase
MATYWTNFAKSGDPNGDSVPAWPNFTTGTERQLHFDDTITAGGVQNLQGLRLLDDRFAKFRADTPTLQK